MLAEKYPEEVKKILAKYPAGAKTLGGHAAALPGAARRRLCHQGSPGRYCQMLDITSTDVAEIVGFYTLYHDTPGRQISHAGLHRSCPVPCVALTSSWSSCVGTWAFKVGRDHLPMA